NAMCTQRLTVAILISLLSFSVVFAQTSAGEVNGTVTDPNGAAVPGATIILISEATKIESRVTSNQNGYFTFVNVKPGNYILRVEMRGFKKAIIPSFTLGVSETATHNVALTVGDIGETVEISGGTEVIQSSSTELGTVIAQRAVEDLPLNGRNFTQLLTLTP